MITFARRKQKTLMNFEEMLNQKGSHSSMAQPTLFGKLVKWKADDGKYINVVEIRRDLSDASGFAKALKDEAARNQQLKHKLQLHFDVADSPDGVLAVRIGQGSISTLDHLVTENPAVVASKHFCRNMLESLLNQATYLHSQGVSHVCFSPDNIFVRRGSNDPLLLMHASAYTSLYDRQLLWKDHEEYVAPEVLEGSTPTDASDVYSVGRLMEYLYSSSAVPVEWRAVVKKATAAAPEDRYATAADMLASLKRRRSCLRGLFIAAGVAAAALLVLFGLNTFTSKTHEMDYLAPAPKEDVDSLLDKGFDEAMEMALLGTQTIDSGMEPGKLSPKQEQAFKEHQAKAEEIFRRQYTKQAERILTRLYGKSRLTMSQEDFVAVSATVTDELVRAQQQLAEMTNLSSARSQLIASEIIDQVTNRLEAARRKSEQKEEENLREKMKQQRQQNDDVTDIIHETVNPDKKDAGKSRTKINQRKALEVEEELKEMNK